MTLWGPPTVANYMPAGISRTTTLRAWLNQWSLDHTNGRLAALAARDRRAGARRAPARPIRPCCPTWASRCTSAAVKAPVRELRRDPGATHYFEGQPELLTEALDAMAAWIRANVGE